MILATLLLLVQAHQAFPLPPRLVVVVVMGLKKMYWPRPLLLSPAQYKGREEGGEEGGAEGRCVLYVIMYINVYMYIIRVQSWSVVST